MPRNGSGGFTRASSDYVAGTIIDETAVNADLNDMGTALAGSIAADGQTPITANLVMSNFKHTSVGAATLQTDYMRTDQVQKGTANLLTSVGGTADVITAMAAFSMTALVSGMRFIAVMASTNTSTTPTLNINSIGVKTIKKGASAALAVGDIIAATVGEFFYDGTDIILLNPAIIPVSDIPGLPGSIITSGEVGATFIADLAASKITTDTFDPARIPTATTTDEGGVELATTGEMAAGTANKIPDADKVKAFVSGFFSSARYVYTTANNTSGPGYTASTWATVLLGNEDYDPDNIGTLSSNRVTLAAGTYQISGTNSAVEDSSGNTQYRMRIRDTTGSTTLLTGSTGHNSGGGSGGGGSTIFGVITLGVSSAIEMQLYTNGTLGTVTPVATGDLEMWNTLSITRIA